MPFGGSSVSARRTTCRNVCSRYTPVEKKTREAHSTLARAACPALRQWSILLNSSRRISLWQQDVTLDSQQQTCGCSSKKDTA